MNQLNGNSESYVYQDENAGRPVVRVRLDLGEGAPFEDAAILNGGTYEDAVLRATNRALGYPPNDEWGFDDLEVYPGMIDLFSCPRNPCLMYSGVKLTVVSPDGDVISGTYKADCPWPSKSLWMAKAFVSIIRSYYGERQIKPHPFRPAKPVTT